jgi:hypothetical protein
VPHGLRTALRTGHGLQLGVDDEKGHLSHQRSHEHSEDQMDRGDVAACIARMAVSPGVRGQLWVDGAIPDWVARWCLASNGADLRPLLALRQVFLHTRPGKRSRPLEEGLGAGRTRELVGLLVRLVALEGDGQAEAGEGRDLAVMVAEARLAALASLLRGSPEAQAVVRGLPEFDRLCRALVGRLASADTASIVWALHVLLAAVADSRLLSRLFTTRNTHMALRVIHTLLASATAGDLLAGTCALLADLSSASLAVHIPSYEDTSGLFAAAAELIPASDLAPPAPFEADAMLLLAHCARCGPALGDLVWRALRGTGRAVVAVRLGLYGGVEPAEAERRDAAASLVLSLAFRDHERASVVGQIPSNQRAILLSHAVEAPPGSQAGRAAARIVAAAALSQPTASVLFGHPGPEVLVPAARAALVAGDHARFVLAGLALTRAKADRFLLVAGAADLAEGLGAALPHLEGDEECLWAWASLLAILPSAAHAPLARVLARHSNPGPAGSADQHPASAPAGALHRLPFSQVQLEESESRSAALEARVLALEADLAFARTALEARAADHAPRSELVRARAAQEAAEDRAAQEAEAAEQLREQLNEAYHKLVVVTEAYIGSRGAPSGAAATRGQLAEAEARAADAEDEAAALRVREATLRANLSEALSGRRDAEAACAILAREGDALKDQNEQLSALVATQQKDAARARAQIAEMQNAVAAKERELIELKTKVTALVSSLHL